MAARLRISAAALVLAVAVAVSFLGIASLGASLRGVGKVVYAKITPQTTFKADQAASMTLVCNFAPASKHATYLLTTKTGSEWVEVHKIARTGNFSGLYKTSVKKLFGSKPVKAGQYRVRISADANSVVRAFTVLKGKSSVTTTTTTTAAPPVLIPEVGNWSTSLSGASFTVSASSNGTDQMRVDFSYDFYYSSPFYPSCSGNYLASGAGFLSAGSFTIEDGLQVNGTFDTPTTAHGSLSVYAVSDSNCSVTVESKTWTATR